MEKLYAADNINTFRNTVSFDALENADIPRSTLDACRRFAEGIANYRFLLVCGWNYNSKKNLMTVIKGHFEEQQTEYEQLLIEHFTDRLIEGVQSGNIQDFRRRYEDVPFLIIDGIEYIAGKSATQEELYRYIRSRFYNDKPTLIMASQKLEDYKLELRVHELLSHWVMVSV